jgi:glucose-6-phosphate isomerase
MASTRPTQRLMASPTWLALEAHYQTIRAVHLRQFFADDPGRDARFAVEAKVQNA